MIKSGGKKSHSNHDDDRRDSVLGGGSHAHVESESEAVRDNSRKRAAEKATA